MKLKLMNPLFVDDEFKVSEALDKLKEKIKDKKLIIDGSAQTLEEVQTLRKIFSKKKIDILVIHPEESEFEKIVMAQKIESDEITQSLMIKL